MVRIIQNIILLDLNEIAQIVRFCNLAQVFAKFGL